MSASANFGVSASIQTHIYDIDNPYPPDNGQRADTFWVGSSLVNGAFIQFGFGFQPGRLCLRAFFQVNGTGTCMGGWDVIPNGDARWFWEYWPDWQGKLGVYSQIGPSMSVGANATWHTYYIADSLNQRWSFVLDGRQVGSMNVTPSESVDKPIVSAEQVTTEAPVRLGPVEFKNLSYFSSGVWRPVEFLKAVLDCGGFGIGICSTPNPYNVTLLGENDVIAGSLTPVVRASSTRTSTATKSELASYSNYYAIALILFVTISVVTIYHLSRRRSLQLPEPHSNG
jgi:hypothetical protein